MDTSSILLVDNTAPPERAADDAAVSRTTTSASAALSRNSSRLWSRPSIRGELTKRKYAKWQPDRLGVVAGDSAAAGVSDQALSSDERPLLPTGTNTSTNTFSNASTREENNTTANNNGPQSQSASESEHGSGPSLERTTNTNTNNSQRKTAPKSKLKITGLKPGTELDILYENQRGWFFFGVPLYSHRSLLNTDPEPWITADGRRSLVNITNAQVPDPSWDWVWRTWYVDMSGDVDDQGWQYAFSFGSSAWHGTHPFCHSFVRRRRWVRLRVKRVAERVRRGRPTGLEMAHMLNEDYFTIHSALRSKAVRAASSERASRTTSVNLSRAATRVEDEPSLEEIRDIPTLMYALRAAIVDREKLDAVRKFVEQGGDELYYLEEKIPEVMSRFVYQTSRWQLLTYLRSTIHALSQQVSKETEQEEQETRRKQDYLSKAADRARGHLIGPEVFHEPSQVRTGESAIEMLDLTPETSRDSLLSRCSGKFSFRPMDNGGPIKGIPQEAEIGHEVHIY